MNKRYFQYTGILFLSILTVATINLTLIEPDESVAQLFGSSDKDDRMLRELQKLNARIVGKVLPRMDKIMSTQADLSQQIDELKSSLPGLQGAIEKNHADFIRKIRALNGNLNKFKLALAKDIEQFAKYNKDTQDLEAIEKHLKRINERLAIF